jgi:IclR family pca regulon transcriptional regulator
VGASDKDRYISRSLVKGLEILKLFSAENPTLSLAEIADKLGVSRTTPFRLLYTLQDVGYLDQDEHTKRYSLTPKVLELGFTYLHTLQLSDIAQPYLEKLRDETGASAHIGILDGREVVYIARASARGVPTINVTVGSRLPAHATAIGKLLLAFEPAERLNELLVGTELNKYTHYTKSMIFELQQELDKIKSQGYAVSNEEFENGICSVAAPIFNNHSKVIAAVNIATPVFTLKDGILEKVFLPALREVSEQLSISSGYRLANPYERK